jgi:hypothetical protein
MKSFKAYLTESHKTYNFRIRMACEMTSEIETKTKQALEQFKVESISKPKRLPIHESPLFPNMGPVEINIFDISIAYPANDDQVRNALAECGCCPAANIRVTPTDSPFEAIMDGTEVSNLGGKQGEAVLLQQTMERERPGAGGAALVGDDRIPNLIKELEETRKYHYPEAAGGNTPKGKTSNDFPQGTTSPMGSKQNKIPSSGKK